MSQQTQVMAVFAEKQRPKQKVTSALNSLGMVESSALDPYILPDFSAEWRADAVFIRH